MAASAVLDTLMQILYGARTEIALFAMAVCAHAVLFGKYRVRRTTKPSQSKRIQAAGSPNESYREPARNSGGVAAPLVRALRPMMQSDSGSDLMRLEIECFVKNRSPEDIKDILSSLLETLGKATNADLICAVRSVLKPRNLKPSVGLGELLLRSLLGLKLTAEFDELFAELEAADAVGPSTRLLALRRAVSFADLDAALGRLSGAAWAFKAGTASALPQALTAQLARLASEKSAMPALLKELQACGVLSGWILATILAECAQRGDADALCKAEECARAGNVEFTATAYGVLLRASEDNAEIQRLFKEAIACGLGSEDAVLSAVAKRATDMEDKDLAMSFLAAMPTVPSAEAGAAALRLASAGLVKIRKSTTTDEAVLDLFANHISNVELTDAGAAQLVAQAAIKMGRLDVLKKLLENASDSSRQVAILKSVGSEKRLKDVFQVFEACPEKHVCLYNAVLDICIDCEDIESAERIMDQALSAGVADVVTYNTIIKAHLRVGNVKRARAAIETMRSNGQPPNCVTFNELVDAVVRSGRDGAWDIIAEMKACGLQPNHVTCSILLKSIQRGSRTVDIENTLRVVEAMEDDMDEVLLSSVCEACIRVGRADLLTRQLRRQRTSKAIQVKGAHTYGSLIRAYSFVKDLKGVWETWRDMRMRHIVPTSITIGCMVEALVSNGDVEAGYELIREVMGDSQTRPLVNAVIYCSVLKGFCHQKQFDRVWQIHDEMLAEKLQFSIVTYNAIIDACARSCQMVKIPPLLEEMTRQGIEPNVITYSTILKGYCQENRLDKAFELLEDMKNGMQFTPDEITYNTILDGCARQGLYDRGMGVLKEMQDVGVNPSNFTLSVLVKLANRSKRPQQAFDICEELSKKYNLKLNMHVYNNLVHACTAHKDTKRSLVVFEEMLRAHLKPDTRTYTLLLRGCISEGYGQDAAGLLRSACGLHGPHPRTACFDTVAIQPKGGLPSDLIAEVLEGIAIQCGEQTLAVSLLRDLRRVPGCRLDPKLHLRIASQAIYH